MSPRPVPVVLVGGNGHGRWHRRNLARLAADGRVRLAGVCELQPLPEAELAGFGRVEQSTHLRDLLERTGATVTIVCTPIQTHVDLALTAARVGSHILLEKPPAPSQRAFQQLTEGLRDAGAVCQIGFQSLGSHAVEAIRELVAEGAIGRLRGIGAAGAWVRDAEYYARAPWAGRRRLDGQDVVDGALTNPLAHAVATALRIEGGDRAEDIAAVELEQFRANDIEADDTSCLRLRTAGGTTITVAVTLCAERAGEPYVVVHGDQGRITFWYKEGRVLLQRAGRGPEERLHGRTDLLENLLEHLRSGVPLLVPPERAGAFMRVVEAVRSAPPPVRLPGGTWYTVTAEPGGGRPVAPRRVVPGVDSLVEASAERLALFSELGVEWARAASDSVADTAGEASTPRAP
ncbi:Gfo/Idh/MocA family protein [Streptomyces sp. TP-A0874]|uniref:Gfo/Idh/MocA family protein n=1 Tax=Streptomyces sp. TP-A0874 TaxID=549819 RepID=UPI0008532DFF|nr:Gfo/Idh/MocA family oxidoreductase [Streptomyces sp. TP-A0874]